MGNDAALAANLRFWHWYPQLLTRDLSPEQLRWQPDGHDTSIIFALWHTYRAADELVHGLALGRPSVFASGGWADRLPVEKIGVTPFGNAASREQIAGVQPPLDDVLAYATAVGDSIIDAVGAMTPEQAAQEVALPFFAQVYPGYDRMSRLDTIMFFAVGHTAEHLGEVQFIRGMLGLKGAPL